MRAMVLHRAHERLTMEERPDPAPGPGRIRLRVEACGVCRTDLHVADGELPNPKLPIVPGHEIVGQVDAVGDGVGPQAWRPLWRGPGSATRAGTCPIAGATAKICAIGAASPATPAMALRHPYDRRSAIMSFRFRPFDPVAAAAPLCAGLIGWRSLKLAGDRAEDRRLRFRRRRAHHRSGLSVAGAARLRLHPAGGRRWTGARALGGGGLGRRVGGSAARAARRRHFVRAGWRACSRRACRLAQGRPGYLRRHPHERYPRVPV